MTIELKKILSELEKFAPLNFQESYDNSGLLIGNENALVKKALICLDVTEEVIEEAISVGADLIISHHPLLFKGIKRLNGKSLTERCIMKAIMHSINIYAIHTNLDNVLQGSNQILAEKLGLKNLRVMQPIENTHLKLVCFCPVAYTTKVRDALFVAGGGEIGNYDQCSFVSEGEGSFRAGVNSNPFVGEINTIHFEKEQRLEMLFPRHLKSKVIKALLESHPYEEVAYDLLNVENTFSSLGAGIIGQLDSVVDTKHFLDTLKRVTQTKCIKHTNLCKSTIKSVAICGGSGSFLISKAKQLKADIYITADVKYHEFFDAENEIIIADIGHYESEFLIKELLYKQITEKFATFAVQISELNTNPVNYL